MWVALYPVLGRWGRISTFVLGSAWTVLMSLAVVGALWHTPVDVIGSVLLSVGLITAGGSFFERKATPSTSGPDRRAPVLNRA
jgi:membrane-associated phospholipid phosphatase